ncbi:hypothetical protein BXZ70DRAFT_689650 [Cristinia sonorae]|uniref:Ubiquitin 3 binding protein But2 C-terminal domain-containing protein n=1 Tax=Cristinia sonorae TaxID=1940300 RepID=A0A8K0UEE7_9AGAR|nr:hypothetical protein BXZ70DRAFT_689650 [Cristinia sonorae]
MYKSLRAQPESEEEFALLSAGSRSSDDIEEEKAYSRPSKYGPNWLALIILFLVLVDLSAFLYIARLFLSTADNGKPLPVANTYVGLDDLYASGRVNASVYPPIKNRARVDAQISASEPNKVFPVDRLRKLSELGRISPPDLRLRVENDIHTIVQFRVIDYGMERCQLAIHLPERGANLSEPFIFPIGVDFLHLNVCKLDSTELIDVFKLSYNTRPQCVENLGTVVVSPGGEAKLPEFACKWSEHHAFEISCAEKSPACVLDVRATQYDTWGAFMYQYQTV